MARRHYNLPPLTTLATFEVAGRHLSFKDASRELNVTPGAVSHQIKALEAELGITLFVRKHRGVELTSGGAQLFAALEYSFSEISAALARLRKTSDGYSVSVSTTTAVSSLWLTPRLARFWTEFGGIPVNQNVSDNARQMIDTDLRIQYGSTKDKTKVQAKLFQDELVPLCSPALRDKFGTPSLPELAQLPLIHLEADDVTWTTWQTWFRTLGYDGPLATGQKVNNYSIALQSAEEGAGIVMGWQRLVSPMIARGSLVKINEFSMRAPHNFYIVSDPDEYLSPNAAILKKWIIENI